MAVVDRAPPVPQTAAPLSDGQLLLQAVTRPAYVVNIGQPAPTPWIPFRQPSVQGDGLRVAQPRLEAAGHRR